MATRQRVIFAYKSSQSGVGSKIMRVDQLISASRELIGERWDFETLPLARQRQTRRLRRASLHMKDAIVIFLKGSFAHGKDEAQKHWSDAARATAIDYVDSRINQPISAPVTLHIAASRAGANALSQHLGPEANVGLLDHHWDPRLEKLDGAAKEFGCGYFCHIANTTLSTRTSRRLSQPIGLEDELTTETFRRMSTTALHFGVRDMGPEIDRTVFKPFTKGFNAAASGANIIVNRNVDDAIAFLGADYPFLIEATDDDTVETGLAHAKATFGSPIWSSALDRMRSIREQTSLKACVAQLDARLSEIMDLTS